MDFSCIKQCVDAKKAELEGMAQNQLAFKTELLKWVASNQENIITAIKSSKYDSVSFQTSVDSSVFNESTHAQMQKLMRDISHILKFNVYIINGIEHKAHLTITL